VAIAAVEEHTAKASDWSVLTGRTISNTSSMPKDLPAYEPTTGQQMPLAPQHDNLSSKLLIKGHNKNIRRHKKFTR